MIVKNLNKDLKKLDESINNLISNSIKNKDFKAEKNEIKSFYINNNITTTTSHTTAGSAACKVAKAKLLYPFSLFTLAYV